MTAARELPFLVAGGELGRLVVEHDWTATSLGPIASWPTPLRTAVGLALESRQPMLVWCGPELVVVYNDAFRARAGRLHPGALGAPGERAFPEAWPVLGGVLRQVLSGAAATSGGDRRLVLHRGDEPEETWWTSNHTPVRDEDGTVLAVLTTTTETTDAVLAARREALLRALSGVCASTADGAAAAVLDVLARDPRDVPFAAVCRGREPRVVASCGLVGELPPLAAPDAAEPAVRWTARTGGRAVVHGLRDRFPGAFDSAAPAPDTAVVLPLPDGAVVLGANPLRPLPEQLGFLERVGDAVAAATTSAGGALPGAALPGAAPPGAAPPGAVPPGDGRDPAPEEERERYRTLVTQVPVGIWVADRRGATTFVNDHVAQLWGLPPAALTGTAWSERVHPDDRAGVAASWAAAVRGGGIWQSTHRISGPGDEVREVRSSARPLRGPRGEITGFLGTTVDITEERRAEQVRRDAATEHAARRVSDAAAARLRAMVQGLAAIVWEAEWDPEVRGLRFTFVSDRAEELLGHPARRWCDDPAFWPTVIHPDDRAAALAFTGDRTAAGVDHDLTYRAVAIDGRVVWLHQVVHVVTDPDGAPVAAQGLTVDVTEQKRAERSAGVLAETGRLVTDGGSAEERLAALARLAVQDLGDAAVVSLVGPDGCLQRVAVAAEEPAVGEALRAVAPARIPPNLLAALAPGLPAVAPIDHALVPAGARNVLGAGNSLVVPLVIRERVVGLLEFVNVGGSRYYQPSELDLAAELGRRASLMLAADRQRARERHLRQVSADLASAGSVAEAARLLVARLPDVLGAVAAGVHLVDPERGIRLVHAVGYPEPALQELRALRIDDPTPIATAVRTGEPVWIRTREELLGDWPDAAAHAVAAERPAAVALPLTAAGRVVGTIGLSFATERTFPADERDFVLALVAQAAPAFERAATADERRVIAETLQTSLLPPTLPRLDRLPLASRYLPGARGTQAGGDWYDVLPLDRDRVAIAVGDVVGQGARAAAIMGQLRSALSGYLLEGHDPVQALERLDRFARRVPGATGSTVACLVLDTASGELRWARGGHPPPLVTGPSGCRALDDATGTVLGVRARPPFRAGAARLEPGESIVLYTDGLVERRGELVDDGIARLAAIAARHQSLAPEALTDALLAGALDGDGPDPADDVALIVARLAPAPQRLVLPAEAAVLRELRAAVLAWAGATGMTEDELYDLQLAVGEAAANAVEHAYRGRPPGSMLVELARAADGGTRVLVRDEGAWLPAPDDPGHRGRGLQLIRDVSSWMDLQHGLDGTEVRFTLPPGGGSSSPVPPPVPIGPPPAPTGPAALHVTTGDGDGQVVEVHGELDLAGVQAVRTQLLDLAATGRLLTVDLEATTYLASAGIALLVEVDRSARTAGGRLRLRIASAEAVRRALVLSGVGALLEVLPD